MNPRVTGLCIAIVATLSSPVRATDLVDVYRLSAVNDPQYQAAFYAHRASLESMPQARSALLPDIAFNYEKIETRQDVKRSDNTVVVDGKARFPSTNYGLTLTQPIFRFADWVRFNQSKIEVRQADVELAVAEQELLLRVAELYVAVLAAHDNHDYALAEREAVRKELERVESRYRNELASKSDLYDAQARFAVTRSSELEARNLLDDQLEALRESTGQRVANLIPLRESIPLEPPDPADIDAWEENAISRNLTVASRTLAVEIARREVNGKKGGHYPTLDLVARAENRDTGGSLFGGGSEIENAEIALRFNVPLYKGGSVKSGVRQSNYELSRAREDLKAQLFRVRREVRAAYLGVVTGVDKVKAYDESIIAQKAAVNTKQKGYQAGLNTLLQVLDAQRDLYFVKRDWAEARYDYLLSSLRLKQSVATLSPADITAMNALFEEPQPEVAE